MRQSARLCLIAVVLAACVVSSTAQSVNAIFAVSNFVGKAVSVTRLTVTPFLPGPAWSTANGGFLSPYIPPFTRANTPSLTNGTVTVTNLYMDYAYTVCISDGYSTSTSFIFPDSRLIGSNSPIYAAIYISKNSNPNGPYAIPYLPTYSVNFQLNAGWATNINNATGANVNLSGTFSGDGSQLTVLPPGVLTNGVSRIGIGVTSPQYALDLGGTGMAGHTIGDSVYGNGNTVRIDNGAGTMMLNAAASVNLHSFLHGNNIYLDDGLGNVTLISTNGFNFIGSSITAAGASITNLSSASIAPTTGGTLNINMGSGTLSGSGVNVGSVSGNGSGLTGLTASQISGVLTNAVAATGTSNNVTVANGTATIQFGTTTSGAVTNQLVLNGTVYPYLPGVKMFMDISSYSMTNPVEKFTTISDISGLGNDLGCPNTNMVYYAGQTYSNAIVQQDGIGGYPSLVFPQSWQNPGTVANFYALTNNIWNVQMNTNFSITFVLQNTCETNTPNNFSGADGILFELGTNLFGSTQARYVVHSSNSSSVLSGVDRFQDNANASFIPVQGNRSPYVVTVRMQNGFIDTWRDGVQINATNNFAAYPLSVPDSQFLIGQACDAGKIMPQYSTFAGKISAVIVTTNPPTDTQIVNTHAYFMNRLNFGGGVEIRLWGDSQTIGQYGDSGSNDIQILKRAFPAATIVDLSNSGYTSTQLYNRATNVARYRSPKTAAVLDIIHIGYNDQNNNYSYATFTGNLSNLVNLFKSAGDKVLVATLISMSFETNWPALNRTNVVNPFIVSNTIGADGIIDQAQDPLLGQNGSFYTATGTNYYAPYAPYNIHLNGAGYDLLARRWWVPAINYALNLGAGGYATYYGGTNYLFTHVTNGVPTVNNIP